MKTKFKEQKEKENLIIEIAKEYISTKDFIINIRSLADKYNLSKSTIHKYISHDLKEINYELYLNVKRMRYIKKISGIH